MNTPTLSHANLWNMIPGGDSFNDVTQVVELACEGLQLGEMLLTQHFQLTDAMNAIEIMDPRMDNGVVISPPQPGVGVHFDPNQDLSYEEVMWIFDRSIAGEMGWHAGSALSQTVHTLQYVHNLLHITPERHNTRRDRKEPPELVSLVLRALVIGLLKTCDLVWRDITRSLIYDGEDYNSDKFEVSLCENIQLPKVMEGLDSAMQWLKSQPETPQQFGLMQRIQLRQCILQIVSRDNHHQIASFNGQMAHIETARALISIIRAQPSPTPDAGSLAWVAFDPTISRRLVSTAPLRVIQLPDQTESWDALDEMLERLADVLKLQRSIRVTAWLNFLIFRSRKSVARSCNAYVRSITPIPPFIMQLVFQDIAAISVEYLSALATAGGGMLHLNGLAEDPNLLGDFFQDVSNRLQEALQHFFGSWSQNRPRCRRQFSKVLWAWHKLHEDCLQLCTMIQQTAANVPLAALMTQQYPLVIYHLRLTIIIEYTFSGFDLDLYNPSEYPFLYWHLTVILSEQTETLHRLLEMSGSTPNNHIHASDIYLIVQLEYFEALQSMCAASFYMFCGPEIENLSPKLDERRQRINFDKRFEWSFPPPGQSTNLKDVGRPDWEGYSSSIERRRKVENEDSHHQFIQLWEDARNKLHRLRARTEIETATELCSESFHEFITGLDYICIKRLSALNALAEDAFTHPLSQEHSNQFTIIASSWFPDKV